MQVRLLVLVIMNKARHLECSPARVNITLVAEWLKYNDFKEEHAHGVRNLVINPKLLSSGYQ